VNRFVKIGKLQMQHPITVASVAFGYAGDHPRVIDLKPCRPFAGWYRGNRADKRSIHCNAGSNAKPGISAAVQSGFLGKNDSSRGKSA